MLRFIREYFEMRELLRALGREEGNKILVHVRTFVYENRYSYVPQTVKIGLQDVLRHYHSEVADELWANRQFQIGVLDLFDGLSEHGLYELKLMDGPVRMTRSDFFRRVYVTIYQGTPEGLRAA